MAAEVDQKKKAAQVTRKAAMSPVRSSTVREVSVRALGAAAGLLRLVIVDSECPQGGIGATKLKPQACGVPTRPASIQAALVWQFLSGSQTRRCPGMRWLPSPARSCGVVLSTEHPPTKCWADPAC